VATVSIPSEVLTETFKTMRELAGYWNEEVPLRIHSRDTDGGGAPQWHQDFARWLDGASNQTNDRRWAEHREPRVKATRAFRKLRKFAPREYEVVYRTAILGIPFPETIDWLNMRAIRNNKPERYDTDAALMLLIGGVDKAAHWFSI
jgi:hypothetical protein